MKNIKPSPKIGKRLMRLSLLSLFIFYAPNISAQNDNLLHVPSTEPQTETEPSVDVKIASGQNRFTETFQDPTSKSSLTAFSKKQSESENYGIIKISVFKTAAEIKTADSKHKFFAASKGEEFFSAHDNRGLSVNQSKVDFKAKDLMPADEN